MFLQRGLGAVSLGRKDQTADPAGFQNGGFNIGVLIIVIGFWGPLYYNCNKESPKQDWELFRPLLHSTFRLERRTVGL